MATAGEARAWARNALRGIGDSLYTPFCGTDGDDIDWEACGTLVWYCVGDLGHPMLWCTSGIAEFWSLTLIERKRLLEVAIEEARHINPDVVVQACTAAMSAKDCLALTLHAQQVGADIAYIQTPMMEVHGGEGVLRFFRYIADRTDIALGMFNSPSSGYVLTPAESAQIYHQVPAVCAIPVRNSEAARAYRVLGSDRQRQARRGDEFGRDSGLDQFDIDLGPWFTCYPGRSDYFTHWGGAFKHAASILSLPVGTIRIRGLRKPNCLRRLKKRSRMPIVASGLLRRRR